MITKVKIRGYRLYKELTFEPVPGFNLIAGSNESGKSTLLEAICLGLTGRLEGRPASDMLNPYWFNVDVANAFAVSCRAKRSAAWPEIHIELFFEDRDELQRLSGAINSDVPTRSCPGVVFRVLPHPEYEAERSEWMKNPSPLLPVEYYAVEWRSFADEALTRRPRELSTAVIDSRTVRSTSGVDYHMRSILSDGLLPSERAAISLAYRQVKASMSEGALKNVNQRLSHASSAILDRTISIAMDQSARTAWEGAVVPHVGEIPFGMSGQGQQAATKISLAMNRSSARASFVMIEEPENHLSHTSLTLLLSRVAALAGEMQQLFIATHSSFVINRLGLDGLHLLGEGEPCKLSQLRSDTVRYFQRLPGYDTLRLVLADRVVLVEGPSDEIIFERIFLNLHGKRPMEVGVDVLSMRGLSLARCLELCSVLGKKVAAVRDNDGVSGDELRSPLEGWLAAGERELFVGDVECGTTLEPQLVHHNGEAKIRAVLGLSERADLTTWMKREKTEAALRIASSDDNVVPPKYLEDAARFIHGQ